MKVKWIRKYYLILIILLAFIASLLWTYFSYTLIPLHEPVIEEEVHLLYKPDYKIFARSSSTLWPAGSNIELGNAAYFFASDPLVKVLPLVELSGLGEGDVHLNVTSKIFIQAVNDKGEIYWKYNLRQLPEQKISLDRKSAGKQLSGIELDIQNAAAEINRISEEIKFPRAFFQLVLTSEIKIAGKINSRPIDSAFTNVLSCNINEGYFTIASSEQLTTDIILNPEASKVTATPKLASILSHLLYPLLLTLILLVYLISLFIKIFRKSEKESQDHHRFKNWITNGSVYIEGKVRINIHSLEGLVDLAIDLDKRIIFDPEQGKYFVLDDDLAYIYEPVKKPILRNGHTRLGSLLLERGLLSPEQLELGLLYHQKFGTMLGQSLVALGFIDETTLYSTLAAQANISYLELTPDTVVLDKKYLDLLSLDKAKVLNVLPLGKRSDNKLIVACGNPYKEGILKILQDILKTELEIVATRPSLIFSLLDKLDQEKQSAQIKEDAHIKTNTRVYALTQEEMENFTWEYKQGRFDLNIFIKALEYPITENINTIQDSSSLLSYLINTGYFTSEQAHLLLGLKESTQKITGDQSRNKLVPSVLDILEQTEYLSEKDLAWIKKTYPKQTIPLGQFLIDNYLSSSETISCMEYYLCTLEKILI